MMVNRPVQFIVLFVLAAILCGCSQPRTGVAYGTIIKCQQCGKIIKQDLHKKLATADEAKELKVETQKSCCSECSNRLVEVKTGSITKCEDCGKVMSRHVRVVKVKFRDRGGYSVAEQTELCRACRQAREPLPYTMVSTSDASFGDYGDIEGRSRTVYRVRLKVRQLPTQEQMERTAKRIWEKECGSEQESVIFMYLPGMSAEEIAYGVAECDSSGLSDFKVQDVALIGTKWER